VSDPHDPRDADDLAVQERSGGPAAGEPTGLTPDGRDPLRALPPLSRDQATGKAAAPPPTAKKQGAGNTGSGGKKRTRGRAGKGEPGRVAMAFARLADRIAENLDLMLIFVLMAGAQAAVPVGHVLAQDGLVPWMMVALALAAPLRVRALGEGPHPALRHRTSGFDTFMRRLARIGLPISALGLYLAPRWLLLPSPGSGPPLARFDLGLVTLNLSTGVLTALGVGVGAALAAAFFRFISSNHHRTAWDPPGPSDLRFWLPGAFVFIALGLGAGVYDGLLQGAIEGRANRGELPGLLAWAEWLGAGGLLGMVFLAEGLIDGSTRHLRQRVAAGQRDGKRWQPGRFRYALACLGPAMGLWLLMQAIRLLQGQSPGFEQAFVGAMFVLAWVAVIWPPRTPVAMHCLLSEVRPSSGRDEQGGETALDFDQVPKGALRINPVEMRPTRAIHPWLVPVRRGRIEDLDDPVKPLWPRPNRPREHHVLGDASFEPDPISRQPQTQVITVRLRAPDDVTSISGGNAQSRRIVVLRAFPVGAARRGRQRVTYRWDDQNLPPGSMQVVDPTTRELQLRDGDVLVLSSEGVARAYAVEIGSAVYEWGPLSTSRSPQVEDYTPL
jgi:hypothetical protein